MRHGLSRGRGTFGLIGLFCVVAADVGCVHPLEQRLAAYRQAKKAGDNTIAGTYLAEDARIWFAKKEGPGRPLTPKGGPWKDWDRFFHAQSTREDARVVGRTITYISRETNDFYRLIDRQSNPARVTYYFDDNDRITGMLYQRLVPDGRRPPDRMCEFEKWLDEHHPGELEKLAPGGNIIPELQRAKRWKKLLVQWRQDVGLPPIG